METKDETSRINPNALRFLEDLAIDKLNQLLSSQRYVGDVLNYAQHSEILSKKVRTILRDDYANLSAEEQKHDRELTARVMHKLRSSYVRENVIPFSAPEHPVSKPLIRLAAATEEIAEADPDLPISFADFSVEGQHFQMAEEPAQGKILLQGPVPENANQIRFGPYSFPLVRIEHGMLMIDGIGLIEAEGLAESYIADPAEFPITFTVSEE